MTRNARTRRNDLQRAVDRWNGKHPVGTFVTVRRDNGDELITMTRSAAWVLSGHSAVILVFGISGCYLLDRVAPKHVEVTL